MVCSDTSAVQSIVTMKQDEDKLVPIDDHKLFAISGEAGDRVNFSEYVIANVRLYALRNGTRLNTKAVANFTRGELATALRKVRRRGPGGEAGGGGSGPTSDRVVRGLACLSTPPVCLGQAAESPSAWAHGRVRGGWQKAMARTGGGCVLLEHSMVFLQQVAPQPGPSPQPSPCRAAVSLSDKPATRGV